MSDHEAEQVEPRGGCDCTELCSMGPTCPGGMLAGLDGSGCWRTAEQGTPRKTRPGRRIVEFGVVLDEADSIDTYTTYDKAAAAFRSHGGEALVHIVTTISAYVLPDPLTEQELNHG